ncbi:bifunctional [glutamate--ammonia ligase]-adenylyl-L-tyrosine phosphorylase/[glutamate--ammonia-ligase] adenylyltransferase [Methylophaga sp. OBS4]|uniref:bifunctional [glutamate--ammonia ligase]-adenylyl-L-tyrosine phosphorylase/[glutamate--ammonia-ligase] adenylyltransferase n=1 Tax=Methylophaga sp. OBS4 TaxID=2991935 RepID=UPI002257182C|nr:bifunctional [glutamate--ammonia ligase]-adenylyl-L-tyrosine phosphorylase/[glutamate--ammonia-ligase] adenylyltransferase [Methylophaga sp. OBS4]MCX4186349.1 bifunctional [glutamate--ammonia ligase]-adenylyl-L-tyrosine phosphorylase/[glutamate--ammonia-ligase] adenylyltransferase [Methylophaga sp. OBS4]
MTSTFTMPESWQTVLLQNPTLHDSAVSVLTASDFVKQWGERQAGQAEQLLASGLIEKAFEFNDYQQLLTAMLSGVNDEEALHRQLRRFRQQQMVRIIWRDLAGWADLAETMCDLSALADVCIQQTLALLYPWQTAVNGTPYDDDGNEQYLVVLAMGKLGAGELNLSSDIDLIFAYPEEGETQGGGRNLTNAEFFTRLGRKLIQALDNKTVDGFVFRVDMRLRPFGDSGALVTSFDAMEEYYQTQGREWERYAMIKARPVTGTDEAKTQLTNMLRPFVYRRYHDYGMFDSLREMKSMIAGQLHRKGMEDNIKLGAGGIREIEFVGQVFQLIYGGRDKPLQQRPILTILDLLAERNLLSDYAVTELKQAYDFLRRTEHRLQAWADQQTHVLPKTESARERLAGSMGFASWDAFTEVLSQHRQQVHDHFVQLLAAPQAEDEAATDNISLLNASEEEKLSYLQHCGYQEPQVCLEVLDRLMNLHVCRNLSQTGRSRLERLLPLLVQAAAGVENADECLSRLMPLVEAIMRRSAYMSLLVENPLALSQLIKLGAASPLISHQLARFPVLLDELLDPRSLYEVPEKQQQQALLNQFLSSVDEDDLEQQMNRLREFRQIATLHVAAADVAGVLPLMRVGDQLSELAEILLERVWKLAWAHLVARHGYPPITDNDDPQQCGFTILAYGKLGGLELGYGSDLDLVFIFDDTQQGMTNGDRPVELMVFYTRLAQRMIHLLTTVTPGGLLYEVDMRLRPSGASGLLVSPLSGFAEYQRHEAWTWEHQALVRARSVVGDSHLAQKVSQIRKQVLAVSRDEKALAAKVSDMRARMREQLDKSDSQLFDLKQGKGGITDIEFMVQYAVLAWSANLPELLVYTDNIKILDALVAAGKLDQTEGEMLAEAYRYYRSEANHCVLQERPALIPVSQVADYPPQVERIWQRWLGES